jgi:hypothetical protein
MPQPLPPESLPQRVIARIVNFYGAQAGLLAAPPNWDTAIKVSMELPTDVSKEAITFTESRRNFAQSARYKMEWTSYLSSAADATELRIFLTRIYELPILVPLWPDVCELKNDITAGTRLLALSDLPARYSGGWIITDENFTQWEFLIISALDLAGSSLYLPAGGVHQAYPKGTRLYPLMVGRLEERPQPEAITDETADVAFKMKENSDFTGRITPATTAIARVGSHIPVFATTPLWNITPNHVRPLDWTEMPDIVYEEIGFLRQDQQRVYDHRTPRGQELEFYQADRASTARIEYFWRDRRATTLRFMIPTYRGDLRMLADTPVPSHPTWIRCERSFFSNPGRLPQPGDPYIALIDKNDAVTPYPLTSAVDVQPDETRLVAATDVGTFKAATTIISHLLLARFAEATLEWSYTTPYLATTRIKFQEVVMEYPSNIVPVPPAPLPEPAFLFIFVENGIRTDRFTSYENTITIPTGTYAGRYVPAPFSFDTVKAGLKLDQEKLDLKSFKFDGNPLNKMWPFALDGVLTVEIVEVRLNTTDPTAPPGGAVSRFYGDIWSVDSQYKATAIPFGNLFERKFPRFLLSVSDNYTQFSAPTQLAASAFKIGASINGAVNHTSQTLSIAGATAHSKPADYFAGGWLETGTGATLEKRGILHSAPGTGIIVTLAIDRPLLKAPTGAPISLYPGYDGSIDQCDTKFNNRINFGGHAYIPDINPAVKAITPKNVSGGKKG